MVFLNSIESIFSIIIMIFIGYVLASKGWFDEKSTALLPKLVLNISMPALMVWNLCSSFDKEKLVSLRRGLIIPFLSIGICYILGVLVSKIIKVDKKRRGTFQSMFFLSNSIFIGLPVNLALFGDKSVPFVLLYYIANTTFFWTFGAYGISKDGEGVHNSFFSKETFQRIMSPPLLGFLFAILLVLLDIKVPKFVMDTCKYLGNITTPLSMIFIGITIYSLNFKSIKLDKDMIFIFIGRFILSPISVYILSLYYPIPKLMMDVFIIQSAMPVMTNTSIVAKAYNADYEYAAVMTVTTTLASLIFIPIYMSIL